MVGRPNVHNQLTGHGAGNMSKKGDQLEHEMGSSDDEVDEFTTVKGDS